MIRIEGKDQVAIMKTLEHAENFGARFVYIETAKNNEALKQDQLSFFSTKAQANQHQFEQRAQDKYGEVLPVIAVKNHLDRRMDLENITRSPGAVVKDIYLDEKQQAFVERARVAITRETLAQELKDKGIKPDIKAFEQHLRNDEPSFVIRGYKKEDSQEKPYQITIAQNADRLFQIRAIEPVLQVEQSKRENIQSKQLGTVLRVDDAKEILHKLAEAKEQGHHFISFPARKEALSEKDITISKTPFEAWVKAAEQSTGKEQHLVKSIRVIEQELKPLVEQGQQKEVLMQKGERQKGQDLSR